MFVLKGYQERALEALRDYLRLAEQIDDVDAAFYQATREHYGRGVPYQPVLQLPRLPYVCIRIPTGGGKTVVACHSVGIVAQDFLRQERCVVLWLVPTNTIRDQTLTALRDRVHPYRQALEAGVGGSVSMMDISEALCAQRQTLDGETVVIVSTAAAWRVGDTEGRKVYEQNGTLMSHFQGYPDSVLAKLEKYEGSEKPVPSLANVLCLRRPVVIVDEAHNMRTPLSFETLARFDPSCILEFTATPARDSNVLFHISAYELKAESMIKLPIRLEVRPIWREALVSAIDKLRELEELANLERAETGEYLRPIALVQAQPRSQRGDRLTVEVVKQSLAELGVPPEQIAIETGERQEVKTWEYDNKKKLFDDSCPIRYIITVDKLREGWDCPFAYLLCSVREVGASTAVEQILGRVLRMPQAIRKKQDGLNHAYAFVTSHRFGQTANTLADALIANGFTRFEAHTAVESPQQRLGLDVGLFATPEETMPPAERGELFDVPVLALWVDGELEPVEDYHFMQSAWKLADCDARLTEEEFSSRHPAAEAYELDVSEQGRIETRFVSEVQEQLMLVMPQDISTAEELVVWLDRRIRHPDVSQTQAQLFILRTVEHLITERQIPLAALVRDRLRLRDAAARKINEHRQAAVKSEYQRILFGDAASEIEVSPQRVFTYDPDQYPANSFYSGSYEFNKHYYRAVGAMNGEEERCAQLLDSLPKVSYWVRNIERQPDFSFWLQTSTDKFYPDFVALLEDGRVLALEYKGTDRLTTEDTREKVDVGALWQARSGGQCIFVLVSVDDYESRLRNVAS